MRVSKNDIPFRKGYKPQFTDKIFEISAISTKKPPLYILKDLNKEEILGKFYEKKLKMFKLKVNLFLNQISINQLSCILLLLS